MCYFHFVRRVKTIRILFVLNKQKFDLSVIISVHTNIIAIFLWLFKQDISKVPITGLQMEYGSPK